MGWRDRLLGPRDERSGRQQVSDGWKWLRTGRDPRVDRARDEGFEEGYDAGREDGGVVERETGWWERVRRRR